MARDHIQNAIILDGDQIIKNASVLTPEFERSGYNAIWTDTPTNEWVLTVKDDIVTHCSRTGADFGWQLFSVSRWTAADGKKLKAHLENQFEKIKNRKIYWDDVALFCYHDEYKLGIHEMQREDIIEIDGIDELAAEDNSYKKYLTGGLKIENEK